MARALGARARGRLEIVDEPPHDAALHETRGTRRHGFIIEGSGGRPARQQRLAQAVRATGADEFRGNQAMLGEIIAWRNLLWAISDAMAMNPVPWVGDTVLPNAQSGASYRVFAGDDHRKDNPRFSIANRERIARLMRTIDPIARGHGITPAQVVIAWTVQQPGITFALCGARNPEQAKENAGAGRIRLSLGELTAISEAAAHELIDLDA